MKRFYQMCTIIHIPLPIPPLAVMSPQKLPRTKSHLPPCWYTSWGQPKPHHLTSVELTKSKNWRITLCWSNTASILLDCMIVKVKILSPIGSQLCYRHRMSNDMFPANNLCSLCIAQFIKWTTEVTEKVLIKMCFEPQRKRCPSVIKEEETKKNTPFKQSTPCAGISDETRTWQKLVHWIEDCIT